MPYLPAIYTHEVELPGAYDKDLLLQVRVIIEKYRRYYPKIEYFTFKGDVTVSPSLPSDVPTVVGEAGGTAFDPLWGESVPADQLTDGVWQQPNDGSGAAANPELFNPVVIVNCRIQRDAKEKELKKYGFDQIRDLLLFIPTARLDQLGITARAGDEFVWDGYRYQFEQVEATGYWKNTNLPLYLVANCEQKKVGS